MRYRNDAGSHSLCIGKPGKVLFAKPENLYNSGTSTLTYTSTCVDSEDTSNPEFANLCKTYPQQKN